MPFSLTNRKIAIALLLFLLLPFGCGGDDSPPDDAFDSQGVDVMPGPSLVIMTGNGEDFTTNEATMTLEGLTDMTATAVTVGEMKATLTAGEWEYAQAWSIDLDLNEGENTFTIKALDEAGNEGLEKAVSITFAPEYVPDPPENAVMSSFAVSWQSKKCYDPSGSKPSEMRGTMTLQVVYSTGATLSDTKNLYFHTYNGTWVMLGYMKYNWGEGANYTLSLNVYEEDDGFFTGDDDPVGSGSVSFTAAEVQSAIQKTLTIDSNVVYVDSRTYTY